MPLVGNIEDLRWEYEYVPGRPTISPVHIETPHMEVRVIVLRPGVYPPYHAHVEGVDEGYLIYGGRGIIHTGGETFPVGRGDVSMTRRGAMHHMKNVGTDDLIEFNFRGGRMPSGFIFPEDADPFTDPEGVGRPAADRAAYIRGTVEGLRREYDPGAARRGGLPKAIATEHLELQIVSFPPGARPPMHRHQEEMDEATLVLGGRVAFVGEEETVEAGPGDLVHTPGGAWHTVQNTGDAPALLFTFRGGRLPSRTEWR